MLLSSEPVSSRTTTTTAPAQASPPGSSAPSPSSSSVSSRSSSTSSEPTLTHRATAAAPPSASLGGATIRGMNPARQGRFIGYPVDRLLAVIDDPVDAAVIGAELNAGGIPSRDVSILRGTEGAERLDGTGASNGMRARLRRLVDFTIADQ